MILSFHEDRTPVPPFKGRSADQAVDFGPEQANMLVAAFASWFRDTSLPPDLDKLPLISAVNCKLGLVLATQDKSICEVSSSTYDRRITVHSFGRMLELTKPLAKGKAGGYHWLYDVDTPIDLLFSPNGSYGSLSFTL